MRSSFWVGFGVSVSFAAVGLISTDALAAFTRSFGAAACVPVTGPGATPVAWERGPDGTLLNKDPSASMVVTCPVVSDFNSNIGGSTGNGSAISATAAHLYGSSNGLYALAVFACRTYATGSGGICGNGMISLSNGVNDLTFNPSDPWAAGSPNDGFYLIASLGPGSSVFSYTFQR